MDAYRKGYTGALAAYAVKKYTSHRCVSEALDNEINAAALDGYLVDELKGRDKVAQVAGGKGNEEGAGEGAEETQ